MAKQRDEKDKEINIEITREMIEAVTLAQLYRDDPLIALRKVIKEKLNNNELEAIYREILFHPDFSEIKKDTIKLEELTLVDDTVDTISLVYNKMLKEAQFEKKYEVVIRILKELQKLKAIENEETRFEIIITVDKPN